MAIYPEGSLPLSVRCLSILIRIHFEHFDLFPHCLLVESRMMAISFLIEAFLLVCWTFSIFGLRGIFTGGYANIRIIAMMQKILILIFTIGYKFDDYYFYSGSLLIPFFLLSIAYESLFMLLFLPLLLLFVRFEFSNLSLLELTHLPLPLPSDKNGESWKCTLIKHRAKNETIKRTEFEN